MDKNDILKQLTILIASACSDIDNVNEEEIYNNVRIQLPEDGNIEDSVTILITTVKDMINIDTPNYTYVAARIFLNTLYHEATGTFGYNDLRSYIERAEKEGRFIIGIKELYDLDELNDYLKPERDLSFNYLGIRAMYSRYLIKDKEGKVIELPQQLFMGVAMFLAHKEENKQHWVKKFYDILSNFEVMSATPTLSNARTPHPQCSSCFKAGELVTTSKGEKAISDIVVGDLVLTHEKRFKKVYELLNREYNGDYYTLHSHGNRTLPATEEHPILTTVFKNDSSLETNIPELPKWVPIKDLNNGDFVNVPFNGEIDDVEALNIKHLLSIKDSLLQEPINLDEDFFLLLGYFLANGHLANEETGVVFNVNIKHNIIKDDIIRILKSNFGEDLHIETEFGFGLEDSISINSKVVHHTLRYLTTSLSDGKLHNIIKLAEPEKQIMLLIGLARGKGNMNDTATVIQMNNPKLVKELYDISLRCRLSPKLTLDLVKSNKCCSTNKSFLFFYLRDDEEYINQVDIDMHKLDSGKIDNESIDVLWNDDKFFTMITEVTKETINETVYNLEVEEDHSYTVNGFGVHNCYIGATPDDTDGIMDSYKEIAILSKFGGGLGWDWNDIRSSSSAIDGHKNAAGGIVPFMGVTNALIIAFNQLGCVSKNSYVKVLDTVDTNQGAFSFQPLSGKYTFQVDKLVEDGLRLEIERADIRHGSKISKQDINNMLLNYVLNKPVYLNKRNRVGIPIHAVKRIIRKWLDTTRVELGGFKQIPSNMVGGSTDSKFLINELGVVLNARSHKLVSYSTDNKGYLRITFGKSVISVHRLVWKVFNGDTATGLQVDHIDNDKLNPSLVNLQLLTNKDNYDKSRVGTDLTIKATIKSRIRKFITGRAKLNGVIEHRLKLKVSNVDTKTILISEVKVGMLIKSFNIKTKKVEYKRVSKTHDLTVKLEDQLMVCFEDGNFIRTSLWHPFPVKRDGILDYIRTDEVVIGDITINEFGKEVLVSSIDSPTEEVPFFDLTVDDNENYFCSTDNKDGNFHLIHNTRLGAISTYLEPWHEDIDDFIDLKKSSGKTLPFHMVTCVEVA